MKGKKKKYIEILEILEKVYEIPPQNRGRTPVEELIAVILSQNTSDHNSALAYKDLFERYDNFHDIARASELELSLAIKRGGLSNQKARWIKKALETIHEKEGSYSLDFLDNLNDGDAIHYLTSLEGVGPKSARCVLCFSIGRDVFPVDTHIYRVSKRIGLVSPKIKSREKACELLESYISPEHKYRFHMVLINHGRSVCKARKPECDRCLISHICDYYSHNV
ncbi:endonuclease III [bacterium]|nr:endonuclease III [bacterium]